MVAGSSQFVLFENRAVTTDFRISEPHLLCQSHTVVHPTAVCRNQLTLTKLQVKPAMNNHGDSEDQAETSDRGPKPLTYHWIYLGNSTLQDEQNRTVIPEQVCDLWQVLDREENIHWSIDLEVYWMVLSRYETRQSQIDEMYMRGGSTELRDFEYLQQARLSSDRIATVPKMLFPDYKGKHATGIRPEILELDDDEGWYDYKETVHYIASGDMIRNQHTYILNDEEGRDIANSIWQEPDSRTDGGQLITDGGDRSDIEVKRDTDGRLVPEAMIGDNEVLDLTAQEVRSVDEVREQLSIDDAG